MVNEQPPLSPRLHPFVVVIYKENPILLSDNVTRTLLACAFKQLPNHAAPEFNQEKVRWIILLGINPNQSFIMLHYTRVRGRMNTECRDKKYHLLPQSTHTPYNPSNPSTVSTHCLRRLGDAHSFQYYA